MTITPEDLAIIDNLILRRIAAMPRDAGGGIAHREIKRLQKEIDKIKSSGPTALDDMCCFVYQPGGVTVGNVYADWTALMAVIGATEGRKSIVIDDSITSPAPVPAGAYDLNGSSLVGLNDAAAAELQFADGAVLSGVDAVEGNLRVSSISTTPAILVALSEILAVRDGAVIYSQDTGASSPIISLAAGAKIIVDTYGQLQANEDDYLVTVGVGNTARIAIGSSAIVTDYVLSGAGDYLVSLAADASYGRNHAGHAGSRTLTFEDPEQSAYVSLAGGTLPFIGFALATGDLAIPLAAESEGPIFVRADGGARTMTPSGADTVDGGAPGSVVIVQDTYVILKSDGISAWESFV